MTAPTPPIVYNPNTPTKKLSWDQWPKAFRENFTQLYNAFSANHVALDDPTAANRGNHTIVQFPEQSTDPQTASQEFSIYAKDVESQTDQLFFVYPGNSPIVQFTNYQIYTIPSAANQTFNFTFLPGKILIYFGTFGPFGLASYLQLKPPIAKNIISSNFCIRGTTPNYTPASATFTPSFDPIPPKTPDFITQLYMIPSTVGNVFPGNVIIDYVVVANI